MSPIGKPLAFTVGEQSPIALDAYSAWLRARAEPAHHVLTEEDRVELIAANRRHIEVYAIGSRHAACVDRLNGLLQSTAGVYLHFVRQWRPRTSPSRRRVDANSYDHATRSVPSQSANTIAWPRRTSLPRRTELSLSPGRSSPPIGSRQPLA